MAKNPATRKTVDAIRHTGEKRKNIPTAEHQAVMEKGQDAPHVVRYARNTDLDPQLVWRGKDAQDWSDLVVQAPPLYIQEKVHPKVLIDDLLHASRRTEKEAVGANLELFADFNGIPEGVDKTEFYRHDQNWSNRMILGDSLQVMASLAEREGLRGKVQCIYFDPPYGIKFNSNFQWSTTSRDVKDGKADHITREPEQVKAFRDTWRDGIHSYLTYLRDRLTVARDLLTESGSIFVQIGDENVHRVRTVMDEVFGEDNFVSTIAIQKTSYTTADYLPNLFDHVLLYAKHIEGMKFRKNYNYREFSDEDTFESRDLASAGSGASTFDYEYQGQKWYPGSNRHWKTQRVGLARASKAERLFAATNSLRYKRYNRDFPVTEITNTWTDTIVGSFHEPRRYVVETSPKVVARCLLMTTDPGDLVLDPTCGSGTTAFVAEQWGRRWITIDTSRVALALARARIMGARYPLYLLADSAEGLRKEAEVSGRAFVPKPTYSNIRHGFVYERVPHITLKSIANNAEIDVLYDEHQPMVLDALAELNAVLRGHKTPYRVTTGGRQGKDVKFDAAEKAVFTMPSGEVVPAFALVEWEVPREAPKDWPAAAQEPLASFWSARIARQQAIDASIAAKAEYEFLYDKPYEDKKKVRVAGPFTVESLSPHRVLAVDEDDELIDPMTVKSTTVEYGPGQSFVHMILENLKVAGVQQAHKDDRISFTSLHGWPGAFICAEGRYVEGEKEKRAGIFIGPEFGTVSRPDLVDAAREAGEAGFDVLIACAFNYEPLAGEFNKLGRIPVLKARMNADLHMADDLKKSRTGNLFVIFGEPDIDIMNDGDDDGSPGAPRDTLRVRVNGVDVFDPTTGEVRSDSSDGIACWFIDSDYNGESFFVRHAYFLGQNDPYKALKTTLRAEINADAWETLHSDTSRPFPSPSSGRIAVKVINHLGDEVMKVFRVG